MRANIQQIAGYVSAVHAQTQCWAAGREQRTSWSNPKADAVHVSRLTWLAASPATPITTLLPLAALSCFQASGSLNMGTTSPQAFWEFPQALEDGQGTDPPDTMNVQKDLWRKTIP